MLRKIGIPLSSVLLVSTLLYSQVQWKNTRFTRWSHSQVQAILNGSPWTSLIFAGCQPAANADKLFGAEKVFFRIRVLTAKPVREALLREVSLREKIIDIEDLMRPDDFDHALKEFMASRPDDVRVAGDREHIIFSVTILALTNDRWQELDDKESLSNGNIPELTEDAALATNARRRVGLLKYVPPGDDKLGAKLYFPRNLPNGAPLIGPGDRALRFETQVNHRKIAVDFDLRQMKYQGKLEL